MTTIAAFILITFIEKSGAKLNPSIYLGIIVFALFIDYSLGYNPSDDDGDILPSYMR